MRTGGEAIRREFLTGDRKPRRLVLLLDVSGSMEPYARALVRFVPRGGGGAHAGGGVHHRHPADEGDRELSSRDPDAGLRAAAGSVQDWSGGTRLGATLHEFNDQWGVRGPCPRGDRGGGVRRLDRGTPDELAEQIGPPAPGDPPPGVGEPPQAHARLRARWPAGWPPPLPHVDDFIEGHSFDSLEHLAATIAA